MRKIISAMVLAGIMVASPVSAFFDGQTGVIDKQLKAACPAFSAGKYALSDSVAPPGSLPMTDIFEHETGARCLCSRSRTDRTTRCGPTGSAPSKMLHKG
jgi:hypothetical protein